MLLEDGVLPSVVLSWDGWEDWETFRDHYLGEFSPEAIKRERVKVSFIDGRGLETGATDTTPLVADPVVDVE